MNADRRPEERERLRRRRGFTVLELAIVLAIVGILAALGYDALRWARPRANFEGTSAELQAFVHAARQQALASGYPVAVLVFPDYRGQGSFGRFVAVRDDPAASLFATASTLKLDNYDPAKQAAPGSVGMVVGSLDLPQDVNVGPVTGLVGTTIVYPYSSITTSVACSFCQTSGDHRGAIVFDARGRATFYSAAGTPSGNANGASVSLYGPALLRGTTFTTSTLVILSGTGSLRTFHNG